MVPPGAKETLLLGDRLHAIPRGMSFSDDELQQARLIRQQESSHLFEVRQVLVGVQAWQQLHFVHMRL